jgi:hypothetical protein
VSSRPRFRNGIEILRVVPEEALQLEGMDLSVFRSRRLLDALAVLSVSTSLAAITGAVFHAMFDPKGEGSLMGVITAVPTLILGTVWAILLRWRATLSQSKLRVGWVLSVPLAALNAALASGLMFFWDHSAHDRWLSFLGGMVLGATFGAILWLPALVTTLLVFGVPIARAQRMAAEGLAGQERGDALVGASSAVIATLALGWVASTSMGSGGSWFLLVLSTLAVVLGLATRMLSRWREGLRRAFVSRVEAGEVPQFRVDDTVQGKVLVRVVPQGEGYRVADFIEEVATLDEQGAVVRGWYGGRT